MLTQDFSYEEIKEALISIPGSKTPGPDGYNSTFFKASWHIIGRDIFEAIHDFIYTGKLLKELNCKKLTLILKLVTPKM
ncbi:hypothetical protein RDABS01_026629 [Bienertia sinuspersici]